MVPKGTLYVQSLRKYYTYMWANTLNLLLLGYNTYMCIMQFLMDDFNFQLLPTCTICLNRFYSWFGMFTLTYFFLNYRNALNENKLLSDDICKKIQGLSFNLCKSSDHIFLYDYGYSFSNINFQKVIDKYNSKFFINVQTNSFNYGFNIVSIKK